VDSRPNNCAITSLIRKSNNPAVLLTPRTSYSILAKGAKAIATADQTAPNFVKTVSLLKALNVDFAPRSLQQEWSGDDEREQQGEGSEENAEENMCGPTMRRVRIRLRIFGDAVHFMDRL
jgi:hypothetical protein